MMNKREIKRSCSFNSCENNNLTEGVHLHRFPKNETRCKVWVDATKNEKLKGISAARLYECAVLCGDHFEDWCFMNIQCKTRLVHNAIPASPKPEPNLLGCSEIPCNTEEKVAKSSILSPMPNIDSTTLTEGYQSLMSTPNSQGFIVSNNNSPNTEPRTNALLRKSKKKYTPKKALLAQKIKKYRDRARRISKHFSKYKKLHSSKKSIKETLSSQGVNADLSNFIERQVALNLNKKGRRFTEYDKIQAYRIYCKSKAAYGALKDILELPSTKTLQRFISSKLSNPGICPDIIDALKEVLKGKESEEKKYALVLDEMALKPGLAYDYTKDRIVGLEDLGDGVRTEQIANQALVLMLRSLKSKKKLPLGFFFSNNAMKGEKLKEVILQALEKLEEAGAEVKAIICDQGANNKKLFSLLGVNETVPFFDFKGEKVFCIFDPPHLLKSLRRSLMKYDLKTSKGTVSFKFIKEFYEKDQLLLAPCAPKLTDLHIQATGLNSMKVSLAAQVFSHSVAAGLTMMILSGWVSATAVATVQFILTIDQLFDSMNGTTKFPLRGKKMRSAAQKTSDHFSFWKETLAFIDSWEFLDPITGNPIRGPGPQNKSGWTLTINSLILLSNEMLKTSSYFMTKRCNQDCLENFFSRIRGNGGNRTNPTPFEFCSSYRLASVNTFSKRSRYSNCEPDGDKLILYLLSTGTDEGEAYFFFWCTCAYT